MSMYLKLGNTNAVTLYTLHNAGGEAYHNLMSRFRANLVISGYPPFAEDSWGQVVIGEETFMVITCIYVHVQRGPF